jgi:hypothetical protein
MNLPIYLCPYIFCMLLILTLCSAFFDTTIPASDFFAIVCTIGQISGQGKTVAKRDFHNLVIIYVIYMFGKPTGEDRGQSLEAEVGSRLR